VPYPFYVNHHISTYGGNIPFSSIPTKIISAMNNSPGENVSQDNLIFSLWYVDGSEDGATEYYLVGFQIEGKYALWSNSYGNIETRQGDIATNIGRMLNSKGIKDQPGTKGMQAYVKKGYAIRIPELFQKNTTLFMLLNKNKTVFKLYHILPQTTFNWFRTVHKAEIYRYDFFSLSALITFSGV
jgi:hypothetical protein